MRDSVPGCVGMKSVLRIMRLAATRPAVRVVGARDGAIGDSSVFFSCARVMRGA